LNAEATVAPAGAGPAETTAEEGERQVPRPRQLRMFPPARPLVERFGVEFFRALPENPGVYFMCGAGDGVLYVGKAKNLRRRLGSYRSANPERVSRKIQRLLNAVERIYWDICEDEAAALARERELLATMRPKFNTVGTYPAPELHFGWRWTNDGLAVGCGVATDDWERRYGGFKRARPAYAALLRLLWRTLHPTAPLTALPLPLTGDAPPAVWTFETRESLDSGRGAEVIEWLDTFFRGAAPELPEWLLPGAAGASRFEAGWRAQDALCLSEFYERAFAPRRSERPPSA